MQEDAPLADEGIEEAKEAGRLLKLHGFEFDVVYTSWLSRALETAWYVMDEMDALWLPIIKTWRMNERYEQKTIFFCVRCLPTMCFLLTTDVSFSC